MNNNIKEALVSFEVAKLLKDKGFDCESNYKLSFGTNNEVGASRISPTKLSDCDKNYRDHNILIPTQALAIEWVMENFKILINIFPYTFNVKNILLWSYNIYKIENNDLVYGLEFPDIDDPSLFPNWKSKKDATDSALEYVLKNLI